MAPIIDASLVFFLLSFQMLLDILGMMALIMWMWVKGVRDSFLCASLLHSILLIVIFHFVLLHLHISWFFYLYYLVIEIYAHTSGHPIRGRFQSMHCVRQQSHLKPSCAQNYQQQCLAVAFVIHPIASCSPS